MEPCAVLIYNSLKLFFANDIFSLWFRQMDWIPVNENIKYEGNQLHEAKLSFNPLS